MLGDFLQCNTLLRLKMLSVGVLNKSPALLALTAGPGAYSERVKMPDPSVVTWLGRVPTPLALFQSRNIRVSI